MNTALRPAPVPTEATQAFWDAAVQGVLLIQRCSVCARTQSVPRPFCRHCGAEAPQWERSAGLGRIYTFTVNHRAANAHMADKLPYVVAVVELDEGPRLMANIAGARPEDVRIGARVRVCFLPLGGGLSLPQFEPADGP
ncbi:MAG TPA: Zn-ribbon domain-containing OB-fold protein [Pseudorhodoferax sp.]|nr:Zn-ribbon domain-containing OB-fold protein [Pseudorhodoferax sp.]